MNKNINKINIAQIGVGYWGPNLLRNLMANPNCNVETVVDVSLDRQKFVKDSYPDLKVKGNLNEILNNDEIDAVVIATPAATHFEIAIKSLEAGKHILVEKPIAKTVEETKLIGDLSKRKGLIAMVGHTFLFNSAVEYVKTMIDSGELGELRYIYSQRVNLGRIRDDVDALWNLAPHDVSILQFWLGNPEKFDVSRNGMDYVQKGIDDVVFLNIKYSNGVLANIHVSWLDPHKIRKVTLVGSKKMVVYDDLADNKIAIYDKGIDRMAILGENMDFDNQNTFKFNHRSGDIIFPSIDYSEPLKKEIEHFLDCILNGVPCIADMNHACQVVNILASK